MTSVLLSGGVKLFSSSRLWSAGDRARGARTWRDARTARVRPAGIGHRRARRDGAIRSRRSPTRDAATPREPRAIFLQLELSGRLPTGHVSVGEKIEGVAAPRGACIDAGGVLAALTSFWAKSSMSMMTSLRSSVSPAILFSLSPSTMIRGESTAADLGIHSLEPARLGALAALPWLGRATAKTPDAAMQVETMLSAASR